MPGVMAGMSVGKAGPQANADNNALSPEQLYADDAGSAPVYADDAATAPVRTQD